MRKSSDAAKSLSVSGDQAGIHEIFQPRNAFPDRNTGPSQEMVMQVTTMGGVSRKRAGYGLGSQGEHFLRQLTREISPKFQAP